jgi:hypothetical protein
MLAMTWETRFPTMKSTYVKIELNLCEDVRRLPERTLGSTRKRPSIIAAGSFLGDGDIITPITGKSPRRQYEIFHVGHEASPRFCAWDSSNIT